MIKIFFGRLLLRRGAALALAALGLSAGFGLSACAVRGGAAQLDETATSAVRPGAAAGRIAPQIAADSPFVLAQLAAAGQEEALRRPWHNSAAGSGGVVSAPAARGAAGRLCRRFETTRQSYDGAALYRGEACKYGALPWQMQYLVEK